ncbi:unnamed protein product [Adineta steineri]|uniref:Uncharacterized protein n=1 Tax=Adineta steineri TaxID=433720 RepID=A0A818PY83_9BILA|nr:unnamed protein product [Adineta steineri]CAF3632626.1 unnamed protein product [Adineta steineri]
MTDSDSSNGDDTTPISDGYNFEALKNAVVKRSVASIWDQAKTEWELYYIYEQQGGTCACGHRPITEHCVIRNRLQPSKLLTVGNKCVEKFQNELSEYSNSLFRCLKRWKDEPDLERRRATTAMIDLFHRRDVLSDNDRDFYLENMRKRTTLSPAQLNWMVNINEKISNALQFPPRTCPTCHSLVYQQISRNNNPYYMCKNHDPPKYVNS